MIKDYFKEVKVSNEEMVVTPEVDQTEVVNVATPEIAPTVVSLSDYVPLTDEQVKEFVSKQPNPQNRMNLDNIKSRIASVEFIHSDRAITCIITLDNGFKTDGTAFVIDKENYVEELGRHYAYQKAYGELIPIAIFLEMEAKKQVAPAINADVPPVGDDLPVSDKSKEDKQ